MSAKPKLLDLFCGAGGCAKGYQRAGFFVRGVDHKRQPRYCGDQFIQADALEYLSRLIKSGEIAGFDAVHASPPCQKYSAMTKGRWKDREHADLIEPTRMLLNRSGRPYVIENVEGAPLLFAIKLCGTHFGLQTDEGSQLRRHRYFESPHIFSLLPDCQHNDGSAIEVYGGGQHPDRRRPATIGVWGNSGGYSKRDDLHHYGIEARRKVMGIDWMNGAELSEAIPPAYTEFIGRQLLAAIQAKEKQSHAL